MIRHGNKIRLTEREKKNFRLDTGRADTPKSVAEFNRHMQNAADAWEAEGTPEAKLLAYLNRIGQIDETKETPSLVVDTLLTEQQHRGQS